jgi:3D (Asp-Asp-Asp) domain-containing protein
MFKSLKLNKFWPYKAIISAIIVVLAFNVSAQEAVAVWQFEDLAVFAGERENSHDLLMIIAGDSLMAVNESLQPKIMRIVLTGYSSTADQTDDTPFITASNTRVRDGIVAANFLAFGTQVKIPAIFGDKVFTVEDRMAKKHNDKMDIWFPERYLARNFGVQEADVVILE